MYGCLHIRILFIDGHSDKDLGEAIGIPLLVHVDFSRGGPRPQVHRMCVRGVLEHCVDLTELLLIDSSYLSDSGWGG